MGWHAVLLTDRLFAPSLGSFPLTELTRTTAHGWGFSNMSSQQEGLNYHHGAIQALVKVTQMVGDCLRLQQGEEREHPVLFVYVVVFLHVWVAVCVCMCDCVFCTQQSLELVENKTENLSGLCFTIQAALGKKSCLLSLRIHWFLSKP